MTQNKRLLTSIWFIIGLIILSRIENNGSNLTLKTLYDIVEKGLGGKVKIQIEI